MNIVRILAGTVAGAITLTLLGWLTFGMLLDSYFKAHMSTQAAAVMRPTPEWLPLILFNLAFAWLFAFIFDYWAKIKTFVTGLKGGALIMLPMVIGINMQYLAFMNMYKDSPIVPVIIDIVATTILGAIAGGVIGLALGMMDKQTNLE